MKSYKIILIAVGLIFSFASYLFAAAIDEVPGAYAAYGLRRLSDSYTGDAIEVRRASDTDGIDTRRIGFSGNALDVVALEVFSREVVPAGEDVYVVTWFDQSSNGADLTQTEESLQPKIVSFGNLLKDEIGRPIIQFFGNTLTSQGVVDIHSRDLTAIFAQQELDNRIDGYQNVFLSVYDRSPHLAGNYVFIYGLIYSVGTLHIWTGDGFSREPTSSGGASFTFLRTIQIVEFKGQEINFYRNRSLTAARTVEVGNGTASTFNIGPYYGNMSEILLYPALSDEDRVKVYNAVNDHFLTGPRNANENALLPQKWQWHVDLYDWLETITEADVTTSPEALRRDLDFSNIPIADLSELWFDMGTKHRGASLILRAEPKWFVLDDGNGSGIEATGSVRIFRDLAPATFFYNLNLSLNGNQGNPYFQDPALGRRILVLAAVEMMKENHHQDKYGTSIDFAGGAMNGWLWGYKSCRHLLDEPTRNAFEEGIVHLADNLVRAGLKNNLGNMETLGIAALANAYTITDDPAAKERYVRHVRKLLFGSEDGTPETTDYKVGLFRKAGYITEGNGPETVYNAQSFFCITEAFANTKGDPKWAFLDGVVQNMSDFKKYQHFPDPDGFYNGPSGYAGRTGGSYVILGYGFQDRLAAAAGSFANARPFANGLIKSRPEMVNDIRNIISISNGHGIGEPYFTMPGTWGHDHWPAENMFYPESGWYSDLKALIDSNDPSMQYPYDNLNSFSKTFDNEFWAYKNNDGSQDFGFFVETLEDPGRFGGWYGGSLQTFWTKNIGKIILTRHDKTGDEPLNGPENTRRWVDEIWINPDNPNQQFLFGIDSWATHHTWGRDENGSAFSTAATNDFSDRVPEITTVTYDLTGSTPNVTTQTTLGPTDVIPWGNDGTRTIIRGEQTGNEIQGIVVVKNNFQVLSNGLRITNTITSEQTDQIDEITELWTTLPIFLRDVRTQRNLSDTRIEYWDGSAWQDMDPTLVITERLRLSRDFGTGLQYVYLVFDQPRRVKLSAHVWQQSYQAQVRIRNVHIDLHGTPGNTITFPASTTIQFDILTSLDTPPPPPDTYAFSSTAGSGTGDYIEGTIIDIIADPPPEGYEFDKWVGDVEYVKDVNTAHTTVTIPGHAITISATYRNIPGATSVLLEDTMERIRSAFADGLPLAGNWNRHHFTPEWQFNSLLPEGHMILPWFDLWNTSRGLSAIEQEKLMFCRENNLPISLITRQWEQDLTGVDPFTGEDWVAKPLDENPNMLHLDGSYLDRTGTIRLSPIGPPEPWRQTGYQNAIQERFRQIQEIYPDPPLVLIVFNNEAKKSNALMDSVKYTERYAEYFEKYGIDPASDHTDPVIRYRVAGAGWSEKYKAMFEGLRSGLTEQAWIDNSVFIGYGMLNNRFPANPQFDPATLKGTYPADAWEGVDCRMYHANWSGTRDYLTDSCQAEIGNLKYAFEKAREGNPDFFKEIIVSFADDTLTKQMEMGTPPQTYTIERYRGVLQFVLWGVRPQLLREFRSVRETLKDQEGNFRALLNSVDRVHKHPVLRRFWLEGELVPNKVTDVPLIIGGRMSSSLDAESVNAELAGVDRMFLLECDANGETQWQSSNRTEVKVFALALVTGVAPNREWLLYAHAPRGDQNGVDILVTDFKWLTGLNVSLSGSFYHIVENSDSITPLDPIHLDSNHPPTAVNDEFSIEINGTLTTTNYIFVDVPGVTRNDMEPDGDPMETVLVTTTAHGDLDFRADGTFNYTPYPGFVGKDNFTYKLTDRQLDSRPATVSINVTDLFRIINDGDPGFEEVAYWRTLVHDEAYGGDLKFTPARMSTGGTTRSEASWTFAGLSSGTYEISASWPPGWSYNEPTDVPYEVFDNGASRGVIRLSQAALPNESLAEGEYWWNSLGSFNITSGTLRVVMTNDAWGRWVMADAIRIVGPGGERIIDNSDPGYQDTARWSYSPGNGYGGDVIVQFGQEKTEPDKLNKATWTFDNFTPAVHEIFATWTASTTRTTIEYDLYDGTATLPSVTIDQTAPPNDLFAQGVWWESLGIYEIDNDSLTVELTNRFKKSKIIADAIAISRPKTTEGYFVDNGDAGYAQVGPHRLEQSSGGGFRNDHDKFVVGGSPNFNPVSRWQLTDLAPGNYEIFATWRQFERWSPPNVTYLIYNDGSLIETVWVNQYEFPDEKKYDGVWWESLGIYNITSGTLEVIVTDGDMPNKRVSADAIWVIPTAEEPLAAPSALTASVDSHTAVTLEWQDNSTAEEGFIIDRAPEYRNYVSIFKQVATVGANTTTFTNSPLLPDTVYYYRVRAYNGSQKTPYTTIVRITTPPETTVPSNYITATAGSGGTINPSGVVWVADGADQVFTIAPNAGYVISDVEIDGASQGAITGHAFTGVTANHTIRATFHRNTHPVITLTRPPAGLTPEDGSTVASSPVTITGTVTDNTSGVIATIDGASLSLGADGSFSHNINLSENVGTTINILARDTDGNETRESLTVTLYTLSINASQTQGPAPLEVTFTANTDVSGVRTTALYEWDFDGKGILDERSNDDNTTIFTFTGPGTFPVTLKVTEITGETSSLTLSITVTRDDTASPRITSSQIAEGTSGGAPLRVFFSAEAEDPDGEIISYSWDFNGDGVYDSSSPSGQIVKTYTTPGAYLATLKVTDDSGLTDTRDVLINVTAPAGVPEVTLAATPNEGTTPLTVTLSANVSGNTTILRYAWDFDGDRIVDKVSTSSIETYEYPNVGEYTAYVRVTTDKRISRIATTKIRVRGQLPDNLSFTKLVQKIEEPAPYTADFAVLIGQRQGVAAYLFDFDGDGCFDLKTRSLENITHTYRRVGFHRAKVVLIGDNGWHKAIIFYIRTTSEDLQTQSPDDTMGTALPPAETIYEVIEETEDILEGDSSNVVSLDDGTEVRLPTPDMVQDGSILSIRTEQADAIPEPLSSTPDPDIRPVGVYRQITIVNSSTIFTKDVVITLPYEDAELSGIDEKTLRIYYYDETGGEWKEIFDSEVYPKENIVKAKTNHFTLFGIGGSIGDAFDSGGGGGITTLEGCFIATAAYGTPMAEEVKALSQFRDKYLLTNKLGKEIVKFYYHRSPALAAKIRQNHSQRRALRCLLKPTVWLVKRLLNAE